MPCSCWPHPLAAPWTPTHAHLPARPPAPPPPTATLAGAAASRRCPAAEPGIACPHTWPQSSAPCRAGARAGPGARRRSTPPLQQRGQQAGWVDGGRWGGRLTRVGSRAAAADHIPRHEGAAVGGCGALTQRGAAARCCAQRLLLVVIVVRRRAPGVDACAGAGAGSSCGRCQAALPHLRRGARGCRSVRAASAHHRMCHTPADAPFNAPQPMPTPQHRSARSTPSASVPRWRTRCRRFVQTGRAWGPSRRQCPVWWTAPVEGEGGGQGGT